VDCKLTTARDQNNEPGSYAQGLREGVQEVHRTRAKEVLGAGG